MFFVLRLFFKVAIFCAVIFTHHAVAHADSTTIAKDARIGGDILRTRFVTDLSQQVDFTVTMLADPYRLVIDMPDVKFRLPADLGRKGRGLVSAFRYGLFAPGKSRIVIDVKFPVNVEKAFVLPPHANQPARLVIDMVRATPKEFARKLAIQRKRSAKLAAIERKTAPREISPPVRKRSGGPYKPVIVIDPGHGGVDPGAIGRKYKTKEKRVVLEFSKHLRAALDELGSYDVVLTRDIDIFIPLRKRVEISRNKGGDLFISVHADSLGRRHMHRARIVRGATVYTLSESASDAEARALARHENRSDIIAGVELEKETGIVTSILIDLAQRETNNLSVAFAERLLKDLGKVTRVRKNGHRSAGFRVLKAPDVPSVLLELGYLSNSADEAVLRSTSWQKKVAKAVAGAIDKHFAKHLAQKKP
jgi:N-acetylmuramoyl-L-alanine amidase